MNRVDTVHKKQELSQDVKAQMQLGPAAKRQEELKKKQEAERKKFLKEEQEELRIRRDSFQTDHDWNENMMGDFNKDAFTLEPIAEDPEDRLANLLKEKERAIEIEDEDTKGASREGAADDKDGGSQNFDEYLS